MCSLCGVWFHCDQPLENYEMIFAGGEAHFVEIDGELYWYLDRPRNVLHRVYWIRYYWDLFCGEYVRYTKLLICPSCELLSLIHI